MALIKHFDNNTNVLTMEFTDTSSLVEYLKHSTVNDAFKGSSLASVQYGSWSGTKTYEEAIDFLQFGWTAESEKLTQQLKLAKQNQPTQSRRKVFQSVVGYTPVVPNYLMGIPTDMLNSKLTTIKQRVVTINKDISYNAGYSEKQIEENSIKAFQIIQALEANGIRCNLNVIWSNDLYSAINVNRIVVKYRIKSSGEKLNISKTSFGLVNPGMLRRIFFRLLETIPELKQEDWRVTSGYGRPTQSGTIKSLVEKQNQYYLARDIGDVEIEAKNFSK